MEGIIERASPHSETNKIFSYFILLGYIFINTVVKETNTFINYN